jgi:hypothetical protein
MLNPSTADADKDDVTIRRCIAFARRDGWSGIDVGNLYAYRSTDPMELDEVEDAFGPQNRDYLAKIAEAAARVHAPIICGWGACGKRHQQHITLVRFLMRSRGATLACLGKTDDGSPRHPSRLSKTAPIEPWP